MKKVLIIAQYFPPAGGGGVQRVTKFVKYLPQFGWEPTVLTVGEDFYRITDNSLMDDVTPGVKVVRTQYLKSKFLARLGVEWLPYLLSAAIRLCRRERFHAVFITGGPFIPFVCGYTLKKVFGLSYVLDFRDAWTLNSYFKKMRFGGQVYNNIVARPLERLTVKNANQVICVCEPMMRDYIQEFPFEDNGKFTVLPNGFDTDDISVTTHSLEKRASVRHPGEINLSHIGSFTPYRTPYVFLEALKSLVDKDKDLVGILRVNFIGGYHNVEIEKKIRYYADSSLKGILQVKGRASHSECAGWLSDSTALLLVTGGDLSEQTGKVFEYIASGKPILALAPSQGAAAQVLKEAGGAIIVPHDNPAAVACGLSELIRLIKTGTDPEQDIEAVSKYHRKELTKKLARILDHAADLTSL